MAQLQGELKLRESWLFNNMSLKQEYGEDRPTQKTCVVQVTSIAVESRHERKFESLRWPETAGSMVLGKHWREDQIASCKMGKCEGGELKLIKVMFENSVGQ